MPGPPHMSRAGPSSVFFQRVAVGLGMCVLFFFFWNKPHGASAFQLPKAAPVAGKRPLPALPTFTARTTATALRAVPGPFFNLDPFFNGAAGGGGPFDALSELTSALGGMGAGAGTGVRAETPVYVGDLGRMGVVMGREVDGQYLVQLPPPANRGRAPMVSESSHVGRD